MDDRIGYGRPPAATRFQKGKSGNPGGTPGPQRAAEKRLQEAVERAMLADPLEFLDRRAPSTTDRATDALVLSAGLGDAEALHRVYKTMRGRQRGRPPARRSKADDSVTFRIG